MCACVPASMYGCLVCVVPAGVKKTVPKSWKPELQVVMNHLM